jgi:transposase
MKKKRIHFPRTTAQQRRLLFQVWEETGDVREACRRAHVSERTFYNWKPRFEAGGYEALERFQSPAPKNPQRTPREVEEQVIEMRRQNQEWGKRRIADEMAKGNNWVPVVSPNTVGGFYETLISGPS